MKSTPALGSALLADGEIVEQGLPDQGRRT
jgi:hypothetical protein